MLCSPKMTTFSTSSKQIPANNPIFINTQQLSHNPDEKSLEMSEHLTSEVDEDTKTATFV